MVQAHRADGIEFQVRDGVLGNWDRDIVNEVVTADCYHIAGWRPNNRVRVVDVGAHIGSFTKWTATRLPLAEVWAFEMMPENYALLRVNVGDLPNVRLQNAALGARAGVVSVTSGGVNTGGHSANWSSQGETPCFDVAELFEEWPYVDCLKMDCEGSEFPILSRIASLPGGLRAHVGCVRAEVHGPRNSAERVEFKRILAESFPYTDEWFNGADPNLSLAYGWR